jgi:hypothetical protein
MSHGRVPVLENELLARPFLLYFLKLRPRFFFPFFDTQKLKGKNRRRRRVPG